MPSYSLIHNKIIGVPLEHLIGYAGQTHSGVIAHRSALLFGLNLKSLIIIGFLGRASSEALKPTFSRQPPSGAVASGEVIIVR